MEKLIPQVTISPRHDRHETYVRLMTTQSRTGYIEAQNCPLQEACSDWVQIQEEDRLESQEIFCKECRQRKTITADKATVATLAFKGVCQECNFWRALVVLADDHGSIRIGGEHYFLGSKGIPPRTPEMAKMYGEEHTILFLDSRQIKTSELLYLGTIPAHFRVALPDNAGFIYHGKRKG